MESFSVKYRSQKNSCMTSDIFLDWFMKEFVLAVKRFLKKKNPQKTILLLDYAPSHPSKDELEKDYQDDVFTSKCYFPYPPNEPRGDQTHQKRYRK